MPSVHHHNHINHMQVAKQHPPHLEQQQQHHINLNHNPNLSVNPNHNHNHHIVNSNNNSRCSNSASEQQQQQQQQQNNNHNSVNNLSSSSSLSSTVSSSSSSSSSSLSLPISFSCSSCKSASGTAAAAISLLSPQLLRFGDIPVSSILRCNSNHQSHEAAANGNGDTEEDAENNAMSENRGLDNNNNSSCCSSSNNNNSTSSITAVNSGGNINSPSGASAHCHCAVAARALGYTSGGGSGGAIGDDGEDDDEIWPADSSWPALDVYSSDDFRMFEFKVRKCVRGRSHDWTECPFSHPGEKARRRDPRRYHYSGTACPDFRKGNCRRGDACEYAHGVFECWLHPARYRTQPCKDGRNCRRRVCFFAHTPEQLRVVPADTESPPTTPRGGGGSGGSGSGSTPTTTSAAASARASLLKAAALSGGAYDGSPLRRALAGSPALELFLEDAARPNTMATTSVGGGSNTNTPSPTNYHPNCPNCNWIGSSPSSTLIPVGTSPSPQSSPVLSPSSPSLCSASSWPTIPAHRRHLDRLRSLPTITIPTYDEPCMSPSSQASSPSKMAEIISTLHNLQIASNASNMHSCREVRSSINAWPNLLSQLQNFHSQSAPTTPQSRYCYGLSSNLGFEGARSSQDAYNSHKLATTTRAASSSLFSQHGGGGGVATVVESMAATVATGDSDTPDLAWVNELVQ